MRAFAALLERLVYTRSRNTKLKLIADYLRTTPDPDRGWALAALTDQLSIAGVKRGAVTQMIFERVDPDLFAMSYDYVGDLAETVALIWPAPPDAVTDMQPETLTLAEAMNRLAVLTRQSAPAGLAAMLDRLDTNERFALLKLATGGLRIGVSARLAKTAFAQAFDVPVEDVEEVWHCVAPPYADLFAWAEGKGPRPDAADMPVFRPFMLAHALEGASIDLADYAAEWKWDGVRVQLAHVGGQTRLYSRAGDDITFSFPEIADAFTQPGVADGELLVRGAGQGAEEHGGAAASFNALQQRLNRKSVTKKMQEEHPAFVRLYDLLFDGAEDVRPLPWTARRARLEVFANKLDAERFDVSQLIPARDFDELARIRESAREAAVEGVMLKRRDSEYVAGRRAGLWYKWKRDPLTADCVLMYAQRGHGKRSSFYSDYTFGCWAEDGSLLPVGKAYFGFTDEELAWLDKFVRNNTVARFGPVREVEKILVLEVAFDSIHESTRHKSGLAMRFPRISRIRTDKPSAEADTIETLRRLVVS
jgi:DNA ligase-1